MGAIYLYAVMAGEHDLYLGHIGLPDGSGPVRTVVAEGLSALIGDYNGPDLSLVSKRELLEMLIVHQQVLEQVDVELRLLPAKFGTLLASDDDAKGVLAHFQPRLADALDDVGDSVEVDLSASWDLSTVLDEIRAVSSLAEEVNAMTSQPAADALAARVQIGQRVQEQVERQREEYRRRIVGELVRLVRDAQPNPRPTDEVVFNVAFLVERDGLAAFDEAVDRLGVEYEGRLQMRYVGPLPPYSFGTVQLARPDPVRIEAARDLLQLGTSVTRGDVQSAYRKLAAQRHPDVNRDDPMAREDFAALTLAHEDLLAYMRGSTRDASDAGDDTRYDLSDEAVRQTLLLEIKREEPQVGP